MRNTEEIIAALLEIREARKLCKDKTLSPDDVQKLRDFIAVNRRKVPAFAMSHFDRLETPGRSGLAEVRNDRCSACGAPLARGEKERLLKTRGIGVCDGCYAFLYLPGAKFDVSESVRGVVGKQRAS